MRSMPVSAVVLTSLTLFLVSLPAVQVWAADPSKEKELAGDGIQKQLQWEEKVVGPKNGKGIDHAKIAALQDQARKDEANRLKEAPSRKPSRAEGIAAPASSTLPTMDIEKPAPTGSVKTPAKKAAARAEAPKSHDAIDDFLAVNGSDHPATMSTSRPDRSRRGKHARRGRLH